MPTLTYHGHAVWEVEGGGHRVLFDPFLTDNPKADVGPEHFDRLDGILVTHGHSDHIGDVEAIARNTDALVVSIVEVANYFSGKGCRAHGMNIGGARDFPFGRVKLTIAHHSSSGPGGVPLGNATGMILEMDGCRIYNAGDTSVFLDMGLIAELSGPFDVALLPVGDNFTMGIDEAVKAAELLGAKINIPMHYNTFPVIEQDPAEFAERLAQRGMNAVVLDPGGTFAVP